MTTSHKAISTLENAGRYILLSRDLESTLGNLSAVDAAQSDNADLNSLALIAVLMAKVVGAPDDDGWQEKVRSQLGVRASDGKIYL